jgi:hypothetical protein
MSVKVGLIGVNKAKSFPKLMIAGELIVFFVKAENGIVLRIEGDYEVGEYQEGFKMSFFTDYEGEITLKNE